jgi:outer membrane protein assembly factor BamE (lipoprotein component of BamABCDE complex)
MKMLSRIFHEIGEFWRRRPCIYWVRELPTLLAVNEAMLRALACIVFMLAACISHDVNQGREFVQANKLRVYRSTKQEAVEILGTPSFYSTFDDNIWYYVNIKKTNVSAFKKGTVHYNILQLTFKDDTLQRMHMTTGDNNVFNFNTGKTPTYGDNVSVLKDFMHNLGKYNQKKDTN